MSRRPIDVRVALALTAVALAAGVAAVVIVAVLAHSVLG
jgi:hypothetical protein